jgi:hypothetical protein
MSLTVVHFHLLHVHRNLILDYVESYVDQDLDTHADCFVIRRITNRVAVLDLSAVTTETKLRTLADTRYRARELKSLE